MYAYGSRRGDHWNFREVETLQPLSKKTGINIDLASNKLHKEFFDLLQSGSMCGSVALASWKHEKIPQLAMTLGCGPEQGCPAFYPDDQFDQVWQIKFVFNPPGPGPRLENNSTRYLKKKRTKNVEKGWQVFGSVVQQNFDPLQYSASVGDYAEESQIGGSWQDPEDL